MPFTIQKYLDKLPDDVDTIKIAGLGLKFIPDLSRFTKLKNLYCHMNQISILPDLPFTLKELICFNNNLIVLPSLPLELEYLDCGNNQLTYLPDLPNTIKELHCSENKLISLPSLPYSLEKLYCRINKLTSLPNLFLCNLKVLNFSYNDISFINELPPFLEKLKFNNNKFVLLPKLPLTVKYKYLDYKNNPLIYDFYSNNDICIIIATNQFYESKIITYINNIYDKIKKFKYLFFYLKFKKKFIKWLWKSREVMIMKKFHPNKICKLLKNGISIDDLELYL